MKTILCFGDSNVWGAIPGDFDPNTGLSGRHNKNQRWAGVLQAILGDAYEVITEGISARTTNKDEIIPGRPYKNGLIQLPVCLETHYPIDLVIFWIGTNDTKIQYECSPKDIAASMRALIQLVKSSNKGPNGNAPDILCIAPQPAMMVDNMNPQMDETSVEKTQKLADAYQKIAEAEKCYFLDAGKYITSSKVDGVHIDKSDQLVIGEVIAKKVQSTILK